MSLIGPGEKKILTDDEELQILEAYAEELAYLEGIDTDIEFDTDE